MPQMYLKVPSYEDLEVATSECNAIRHHHHPNNYNNGGGLCLCLGSRHGHKFNTDTLKAPQGRILFGSKHPDGPVTLVSFDFLLKTSIAHSETSL